LAKTLAELVKETIERIKRGEPSVYNKVQIRGRIKEIVREAKATVLVVSDVEDRSKQDVALRCWRDGVRETAANLNEGLVINATAYINSRKSDRGWWNTEISVANLAVEGAKAADADAGAEPWA